MAKGYLSSDAKAVLRELRRHDRALEVQAERMANVLTEIEFDLTTFVGDERRASIPKEAP